MKASRPPGSTLKRLADALTRPLPPDLASLLLFEMRSYLGRKVARKLSVDPTRRNYLDLGAGPCENQGFISLDFFTNPKAYGADLRFPLLIDSNTFDGIFSEHTLEHLSYPQVSQVLSECRRILKPGGQIRLIVPDLSIFAREYVLGNDVWFRDWEKEVLAPRGRTLGSWMEALSFVTQEFGHRSAWDFETMKRHLSTAGFIDIRKCAFRQGLDQMLLRDRSDRDRTMISLYVEASVPDTNIVGSP